MANRFLGRIGFVAVALAAAVLFQDSSKLISLGAAAVAEGDGRLQVLDLANLLLFSAIVLAGMVLLQASFVLHALPPAARAALIQMGNYMGGYLRREINDHAF